MLMNISKTALAIEHSAARAKYKWEVHVNVRFHMNVRIPTHCMAQDGRRVPLCGQGRQFGHSTRRYSHNIDRFRCTVARKRPRHE